MRVPALLPLLTLSIAACSSSSDNPGNGAGPTTPGNTSPAFRVATTTADEGADGTPDSMFEYAYDDAGRIVTISHTDLLTMGEPSVTTYTYGAHGIVTRSDGSNTETFSYENGRVSQIVSSGDINDDFGYTYDNAGRLTGVVGFIAYIDDDCERTSIDGVEQVPTYQFAYTGEQLTSITGSNGSVVTFSYNAQSKLSTLVTTGTCGDDDETTVSFRYGADGRPLGATSSEAIGSGMAVGSAEETTVSYTNGLLSSVEETLTDFSGTDTTSTTYTYNAQNLLVGAMRSAERNFNDQSQTSTLGISISYEEGRCVEQQTAYPHLAVLLSAQPTFQPGDSAVACYFNLDNF